MIYQLLLDEEVYFNLLQNYGESTEAEQLNEYLEQKKCFRGITMMNDYFPQKILIFNGVLSIIYTTFRHNSTHKTSPDFS